jgi:signal transduction histidine kinase
MVGQRSLYSTILGAKKSLVEEIPRLIMTIESHTSRSTYKNAIAEYIHLTLYQGDIGDFLKQKKWMYAGLHISTALFGDFISLTCKPEEQVSDFNGEPYISGHDGFTEFNFTRFLWPSQTALRNKLTEPLEVRIEINQGELITYDQLKLLDRLLPLDINEEVSLSPDVISDIPDSILETIIIPRSVKDSLQSETIDLSAPGSLLNSPFSFCLKQAYLSLYQTHMRDLQDPYNFSPRACFEAITNTLRLHTAAKLVQPAMGIEPRTVIFYPIVAGRYRLGVFCFVLGTYLDDNDRLILHTLAGDVISNIYLADQLIAYRKIEAAFRSALLSSPLLAHEGARVSQVAFGSVYVAITNLKEEPPRPDAALENLLAADKEYQILDENIRQLKEALYLPIKEKSVLTLTSLERELRRRIPEKDIGHIKFKIPNLQVQIEMPAADRLPSIIAEFVKNGLEAVEQSENSSRETWIDLTIDFSTPYHSAVTDRVDLVVTIRDYGCGMPEEIIAKLSSAPMFSELPSSRSTGKGIQAAKFIEKLCEGRVEYFPSDPGTTWRVTVPGSISMLSTAQTVLNKTGG